MSNLGSKRPNIVIYGVLQLGVNYIRSIQERPGHRQPKNSAAIAAVSVPGGVEVEVVPVVPVGLGPEHGAEGSAGLAVHLPQDPPFAPAAPIIFDQDHAAVLEGEARDVDGPPFPMFRNPRAGLVVPGPA